VLLKNKSRRLVDSTSVIDGNSDSRMIATKISSSKIPRRKDTTDSEPLDATMLFRDAISTNAAKITDLLSNNIFLV
jgi:hypothetical protein